MRSRTIMGSRVLRVGAALGLALAVGTAGPVGASSAARSANRATSCRVPQGDVTWQNNHNGRYLEVYHADTDPGANVDAYPWNCTATQMWVAVNNGAEYFRPPIGTTYDAWSFYNQNNGLCLQDTARPDAQIYSEPCVYGDQQEFAEWGSSSGYYLVADAGDGDEICEHYSGLIDWAITIPLFYSGWGSDKCLWH